MNDALIGFRNVSFSYEPHRPVLDDVSFTLRPGERLGLVGPNGTGKTTLLHLIVGLLLPTGGEIEAFGSARRQERDFHEVRARVGLLFEDPEDQLFCPTVAEDVAFGPLNLGKSHDEALQIVGEVLDSLGLAGYEDRITYKLSAGEKSLVSLATVLAMQPDVLLLDEPANELDEQTEARIIEILAGLPQAMVVVSHDRDFLRQVTDSAALLRDGSLAPCDLGAPVS